MCLEFGFLHLSAMAIEGRTSWCGCWELNWSPLLFNHFSNHSMTSFELLSQLAFIIFDSLSSPISWDTLPSCQGFKIDLTFMLVHGRTGKRSVSSCPLVHVTRYLPNVLIHSFLPGTTSSGKNICPLQITLPFLVQMPGAGLKPFSKSSKSCQLRFCVTPWWNEQITGGSNGLFLGGGTSCLIFLSVKVSAWKLS